MKRTMYTVGSLIILLICAFVFVLVPAMAGGGKQQEGPVFGSYNGKKISYEQNSDMANFVSQYGQYYQSMGMAIDQSTYYYIYNYAFNSTVTKLAAEDAVNKSGYKVPKSAITRKMIPLFSDENGNYSSKAYRSTPESSIASLKKEIEAAEIAARYNQDHFGTNGLFGLKSSESELDFLSAMDTNKRGFNMAVFAMSNYPDSEKIAYAKANPTKFIKYDMSVITVDDEATAKKVMKRLDAEEITFADAVAEYSEKTYSDSDGKLISKYAYQLERNFADAADAMVVGALKAGEKSGIMKTEDGYSIFMADGDSEAADLEADDICKTIYSYLNSYESSVIENYFLAKAKDFVADASLNGFDAACANASIENTEIDPFPLNYGNVSAAGTLNTGITGLASASTNENFLTTAFSLKLNEVSEPMVIDNNVVVLQYTIDGNAAKADADLELEPTLPDVNEYDQESLSNAIMNSPKLKNDFVGAYFKYFMK